MDFELVRQIRFEPPPKVTLKETEKERSKRSNLVFREALGLDFFTFERSTEIKFIEHFH